MFFQFTKPLPRAKKRDIKNELAHRPVACMGVYGCDKHRTAQIDRFKLADPTESRCAAICN